MARSAQAKNWCWAVESGPDRSSSHSAAISPMRTGIRSEDGVLQDRQRAGGRGAPPCGWSAASPAIRAAPGVPGARPDASVRRSTEARSRGSRIAIDRSRRIGSTRLSSASSGAVRRRVGPVTFEPTRGRLAQSPADSASRSRSSRASSSRRTARCGGICSRNAVISPISSNAARDDRRCRRRGGREGGSAIIRSSAGVGQLGAAERQVLEPVRGPAGPPAEAGRNGSPRVWSSAATCAWSRESWNRWTQRLPRAGVPSIGRASSRRTRRSSRPACIPSHRRRRARRRARRDAGRPAGPASRGAARARRRARRSGQGGASSSSRATTALSHSRSPRSASIAMAWCSGSNWRTVRHVPGGDPRLGQPLPGPGSPTSRCRVVPAQARQVVDGRALGARRAGRRPRDGPISVASSGTRGRRAGGGAVIPAADGIEPGRTRSRPLTGPAPSARGRRPDPESSAPVSASCFLAPGRRYRRRRRPTDHFPAAVECPSQDSTSRRHKVSRIPAACPVVDASGRTSDMRRGPCPRRRLLPVRHPSPHRRLHRESILTMEHFEGFQVHAGRCWRKNRSQLPWKMSSMASGG